MLDELKKIGLSENESRAYLALLELGPATAQEISKKSGIKRATTYVQLETLTKLGLVTSFEKAPKNKNGANKTFFRIEDPEHLAKIIEREQKLASERDRALKEILPELGRLYLSSGERPRVRFFEGIEGVKTMLKETFKIKPEEKEVVAIISLDEFLELFPQLSDEYTPERVRRGIKSRVIYTSSHGPILKEFDAKLLRESRFLLKEKLPFASDINVYGNEVAISVVKGTRPFGVILESKEIADSVRALFNLLWESAQK